MAIQNPVLETRPDFFQEFLKDVFGKDELPPSGSGIGLVLHTATDPVAARYLRRVLRHGRRRLRKEAIGYLDGNQLKKLTRYHRWVSHLGPGEGAEKALQESLLSSARENLRKLEGRAVRKPSLLIISSDLFFGHQLRRSDDIGAPLPTSMRIVRSIIGALAPDDVQVVVHRFPSGLSLAGMYQAYAQAGGTGDPGPAGRLWLGRGDLDVERWRMHLHETVGVKSVHILDCPEDSSVAGNIALLEAVDMGLRRAMLPLDDEFRSLGNRRLSLKGSQILARINRSQPSKLQVKKAQHWVTSEFSGSAASVHSETTRFIGEM